MRYLLLLIALICACSKPPEPKPVEIPMLIHTVKFQGETLSIIAAWYTGSVSLRKIIAEANPNLSPNNLKRGQTVKIPKSLLERTKPLSAKFVQNFYKRNLPPAAVETPIAEATPTPEPALEYETDPSSDKLKDQTRDELLKELGIE